MRNVFAHYFTWFARKDAGGNWEHWNWDGPGPKHNPDQIIDGYEDIAAVDIPLIGAYDSGSAKVQRYHLDLAAAAKIDAFCVDWYGPGDSSDDRDKAVNRNFESMLVAAGLHSVKLCICYEEKILHNNPNTDEVTQLGKKHMRHIAERFFSASGYWRVLGRPVLIIWGNNSLETAVWQEMLRELAPFNPWILYSHHDHNPDYVKICDGFYPWVLIGDLKFQRSYLDDYYRAVRGYHTAGKIRTVAGGVWPGFNDTGVWGWGEGPRIIPDPGDSLYDLTWLHVLQQDPEWISITTWNDWNEGTNIEPGVKTGTLRLKKTAHYIAQYKKMDVSRELKIPLDEAINQFKRSGTR